MTELFSLLDGSDMPILVAGPTGSGKSALALQLAANFNGLIINADALQVYQCWKILTARPSEQDQRLAPHALYGHVDMRTDYSVGHWLDEVKDQMDRAHKNNQRAVLVGGTGLYFSCLTQGLADIPPISTDVRKAGNSKISNGELNDMRRFISKHDPLTYAKIDHDNPVRIQRAWEVIEETGKGLSHWQSEQKPALLPSGRFLGVVLQSDPNWLNQRIAHRFSTMVDDGAVQECEAVLKQGWDPTLPSSKAIGAVQIIEHLQGKISLSQAVERSVILSRQYAKRQRSWYRNRMQKWLPVFVSDEGISIVP